MKGERGQATVEYILMLVVMAGFAVLVTRQLISPSLQKLQSVISGKLDSAFSEQNLHRFPVGH